MERPSDLGRLQTSEWDFLQELAERFEQAWRKDGSADLAAFLPPPDDPLRAVALQELIKSDLELRWRNGQNIYLEDYLQRFRELGAPATLPARLVYEEFRVRTLYGDRPELEAYRGRFPEQFEPMRRLLRDEPLPTLSRAAPTPPSPPPHSPAPQPGSPGPMSISSGNILPGGFKLIRRIGTGGFGEVWLAEAPGGVHVAIKIIFRPIDHEEAQRELRSLELIKQLRHPFLLQTQQFQTSEDRLYIVMELAQGSLRDRHKECRQQELPAIPLPELVRYFRESAEAVDYLHAQHVLHRDIKPDNILLLQGHAKVCDFGLARAQQQPTVSVSGSGTPAYMAPEVWKGKASEQSDRYALAMTYAEMRLGRRPFASTDYAGVMFDHLQTPPDLDPLPPGEQQVLVKALAKNPTERYASCREFVQALEDALAAELRAFPTVGPVQPIAATGKGSPDTITDRDASQGGASPYGTIGAKRPVTPTGPTDRTDVEPVPLYPFKPPETSKLLKVAAVLAVVLGLAVGGFLAWSKLGGNSTTRTGDKDVVKDKDRPPDHPDGTIALLPAALDLHAGDRKQVAIEVRRDRFQKPIELTFHDLPRGITIEPATIPADADSVPVVVAVAEEVAKGTYRIKVRAMAGDLQREDDLKLTVEKVDVVLPFGCKKGDGAEVVLAKGKHYYSRIVLNKDGMQVPFILVPQQPGELPFYIMENKVSNEQFGRFAAEKKLAASQWQLGGRGHKDGEDGQDLGVADGRLPVLRVTVTEADQFAKWLGGLLPTTRQWDQAAGYPPRDNRQGPASGLEVAVNRVKEGPMPVGSAPDDRSPRHVRDMAGNGREWTRNLVKNEMMVGDPGVLVETDLVILRGRSYTSAEGPLLYSDLQFEQTKPQTHYYHKASPYTGFRVVLEKLE